MEFTMACDMAGIKTFWETYLGTVKQQRVAMFVLGILIGVLAVKSAIILAFFALVVIGVVGYGFPFVVRTHDALERWTWQLVIFTIIVGISMAVVSAWIMAAHLHESMGLWAWLFGIAFAIGAFAEWESSIPLEDFREYA